MDVAEDRGMNPKNRPGSREPAAIRRARERAAKENGSERPYYFLDERHAHFADAFEVLGLDWRFLGEFVDKSIPCFEFSAHGGATVRVNIHNKAGTSKAESSMKDALCVRRGLDCLVCFGPFPKMRESSIDFGRALIWREEEPPGWNWHKACLQWHEEPAQWGLYLPDCGHETMLNMNTKGPWPGMLPTGRVIK